jgi:hypothetical protein
MIKKLVALANKYQIVVAFICFLIAIATIHTVGMDLLERSTLNPEWTERIDAENTNCNLCLAQFPQTNCTVDSTTRACEALKDYCVGNCTRTAYT